MLKDSIGKRPVLILLLFAIIAGICWKAQLNLMLSWGTSRLVDLTHWLCRCSRCFSQYCCKFAKKEAEIPNFLFWKFQQVVCSSVAISIYQKLVLGGVRWAITHFLSVLILPFCECSNRLVCKHIFFLRFAAPRLVVHLRPNPSSPYDHCLAPLSTGQMPALSRPW